MNIFPSLMVLFAGVCWGLINLFVNALNAAGLDSLQIALVRMFAASLMFAGFLLITARNKFRIRLRDIWMFLGSGIVSVVLFNTCYFYTMTHGQISVAVVLLYTSPIFILLLSALLFKEKISAKKLLALVLTFAGCVCVSGLLGGSYAMEPIVLLTGIASGFFYGLYTIFGRYALEKYDSMTLTVYTFLFAFAGSLPLADVGDALSILQASPKLWLYIFGLGLVSTVLPYFCYSWGLQRMEAGKAAILVAIEPVVGAILGMTVYHEPHNALKLIGIALVLAAIVLLNLENFPKKKSSASDKEAPC